MRVLLFITTLAILNATQIDTSNDCLINYLRQKNFDDDIFNKTALITSLADPCLRRIKSEKDSVFLTAFQNFEKKPEYASEFDCFIESIRNDEHFHHLLLKKKAIESIKLSWKAKLNPKNWIASNKKKARKNVEAEINSIEFENLFVCEYEKKFTEDFKSYQKDLKDGGEAYCIRKHLQGSIKINESSQVTLNCDEIITTLKSQIFTKLQRFYSSKKKSVRKCVNELLISEDYYSPALSAMTSDNIQKDGNDQKKKIYVESMMNIFRKILKTCYKK